MYRGVSWWSRSAGFDPYISLRTGLGRGGVDDRMDVTGSVEQTWPGLSY